MKKFALSLLIPVAAFAQDIRVSGNSTATDVMRSTNTNTASSDRVAVHGLSTPAANFGIGVQGTGGYMGLRGVVNAAGGGSRYGTYGSAQGGTGSNYGVYGSAFTANASSKYGLYGTASGDGGTKYGVYGTATGTGTNYGVYCNGNGVYTGTWAKLSDSRTKKNVQDYSGALARVMAVGIKRYEFDPASFPNVNMKAKSEIGVIAQDLEKIFPEIVQDIAAPASQDLSKDAAAAVVTLKGVDYIALVPILLQAIKEQQTQIDALKKKIGG